MVTQASTLINREVPGIIPRIDSTRWTSGGTSSTIVNVPPPYDSQTKDRLAVLKIFPTDEDTTSLQVQQFRNELKLSVKFRQKVRLLPLIWRKK